MTDTSKAAIAAVVDRLQDHLTLKWMSPPSKITGEECQMITVEALEQTLCLISALEAERDALKQINANLMGDDENVPRYTTRRLKQEIARHMEAAEALNASLISALEAERDALLDGNGWVYLNPDSGMEHRPDHPIESGECPDAELIRRSTSQEDALGQHAQHWFTRAEAAEALNATLQTQRERKWCLSCGTVTQTDECDCTRTEQPGSQNLVNYADELRRENATLQAKLEKAAEALEWALDELGQTKITICHTNAPIPPSPPYGRRQNEPT